MKKKTLKKKVKKKAIFIYPLWLICDLTVNCKETQDFVQLPCISLLWHTWNDNENVLEMCENVFEKVLEKFWNFFLETCTHHVETTLLILW